MVRWIRFAMLTLVIFFAYARRASATTYYICAATGSPCNASDSNAGTSKTATWLHAPGMPNCSGTCASTTPQPGDNYIFRGGDTWHLNNSSATVYIGGTWNWTWSGSGTNCNYPGSTASCIYIGVDTTWYSGSSFARPILTGDNPTSTSLVASCAYNGGVGTVFNGSIFGLVVFGTGGSRADYFIFDNFELTGMCSTAGTAQYMAHYGNYNVFSNLYFHGWTQTATDGNYMINAGTGNLPNTHTIYTYDVFDGSDSYCVGNNLCSGSVGTGDAYDWDHNVCRWIAGCISSPNNLYTVHDNLFENVYESYTGTVHGDVVHMYGNAFSAGTPMYYYNNTVRNTFNGTNIVLDLSQGGTLYAFGNVVFGISGGSCFTPQFTAANDTLTTYFYNNTFDNAVTCQPYTSTTFGSATGGTENWHVCNNHMIAYTGPMSSVIGTQAGYGLTTNVIEDCGSATEIFETESAANAQGYTTSNNYQPTSTSGATYHAGSNESSDCSTFSADSALCNGSTGGVTSGSGTIPVPYISSPLARGSTWDAGAYQFSSGGQSTSTQPPSPPADLTASVQ